ncbi:hypothetical protein DYB26_011187 [Aphanomyces astaci]|uniref:PiggyBac transposable element-derived protein domain-containing protein n=1 Tax=Aphanomyces astaci TaxID=112090 RepID=A0A3R7FBS1_APHAT|nr:hypothetical protein DYB26_011187 [Aphanomyces astaci]
MRARTTLVPAHPQAPSADSIAEAVMKMLQDQKPAQPSKTTSTTKQTTLDVFVVPKSIPSARSAHEAWCQWFYADVPGGRPCALKDFTKEMIKSDHKKYSERVTLSLAFKKFQTYELFESAYAGHTETYSSAVYDTKRERAVECQAVRTKCENYVHRSCINAAKNGSLYQLSAEESASLQYQVPYKYYIEQTLSQSRVQDSYIGTLSAVDMQELKAEGNDGEGSTDEYFVDEGNDTSGSSDEDFSEYFDRTWKKKATISTNDIEGLGNVRREYDAKCIGPQDLYEHDDGTTAPVDIKIRPQFEDLFVDPTRVQVVLEERNNLRIHDARYLSIHLPLLLYPVRICFVDGKTVRSVMSIDRFKAIRACLTFNDVEVKEDPLWRLRPLINLLKASFKMFVVAGREISVDEASIPCRSSHARALIVYNPMKPLGKYHFRIYTAACATSWYVHSFKIHSKASSNFDTLDDQDFGKDDANSEEGSGEAEQMKPSTVRQHGLDITKQWEGSRRVVNMDNWYTSVQLCLTLSAMGMYCRGTIRGNRAHNPRFAMFNKNEVQSNTRGHSRMAYVPEHKMVAVS